MQHTTTMQPVWVRWIDCGNGCHTLTGPTGHSVYIEDGDSRFWEGYASDINDPAATGCETAVTGDPLDDDETLEDAKLTALRWLTVRWIRTVCALELGSGITYPYFNADYRAGETADEALWRIYTAERRHHDDDLHTVLVMCHG